MLFLKNNDQVGMCSLNTHYVLCSACLGWHFAVPTLRILFKDVSLGCIFDCLKWKTTYETPSSQPMEQATALKPSYYILWYSSYCIQSYLSDIYNYPIQSLTCFRHSWRMACLRAQCWGLFSSFCTLYLSPISLPAILYHRSHNSRNKQLAMKRTNLSKNSKHVHNMFWCHIMT